MDKDIELRKKAETPSTSGEVDMDLWVERWTYRAHRSVEEVKELAIVRQAKGG